MSVTWQPACATSACCQGICTEAQLHQSQPVNANWVLAVQPRRGSITAHTAFSEDNNYAIQQQLSDVLEAPADSLCSRGSIMSEIEQTLSPTSWCSNATMSYADP